MPRTHAPPPPGKQHALCAKRPAADGHGTTVPSVCAPSSPGFDGTARPRLVCQPRFDTKIHPLKKQRAPARRKREIHQFARHPESAKEIGQFGPRRNTNKIVATTPVTSTPKTPWPRESLRRTAVVQPRPVISCPAPDRQPPTARNITPKGQWRQPPDNGHPCHCRLAVFRAMARVTRPFPPGSPVCASELAGQGYGALPRAQIGR